MKWISEDRKRNFILFHKPQKFPEIRVQNWIAASDIKIRQPVIDLAEVQAVIKRVLYLLPVHAVQLLIAIFRKNVAVLAPLIAFIGDVPLKRKILFHHNLLQIQNLLSDLLPKSPVLDIFTPRWK